MAKVMKKSGEAGAMKAGEAEGRRKEKMPMQGGEDGEEGGRRVEGLKSAGTSGTTGGPSRGGETEVERECRVRAEIKELRDEVIGGMAYQAAVEEGHAEPVQRAKALLKETARNYDSSVKAAQEMIDEYRWRKKLEQHDEAARKKRKREESDGEQNTPPPKAKGGGKRGSSGSDSESEDEEESGGEDSAEEEDDDEEDMAGPGDEDEDEGEEGGGVEKEKKKAKTGKVDEDLWYNSCVDGDHSVTFRKMMKQQSRERIRADSTAEFVNVPGMATNYNPEKPNEERKEWQKSAAIDKRVMEVLAGRMQNLVDKAQFEKVADRKALQQCAKELVHEAQTQTAYQVIQMNSGIAMMSAVQNECRHGVWGKDVRKMLARVKKDVGKLGEELQKKTPKRSRGRGKGQERGFDGGGMQMFRGQQPYGGAGGFSYGQPRLNWMQGRGRGFGRGRG